ncbi:S9 family peptidase [Salsipaludibacter albus]|uniref:S9 family peptidase n=1 Tax=Salsipaludibacter albus TaxID=2849650 RepID=UPI001EE4E24F|nr:S9 family peptidase [Salsipaludibacter albus]
MHVLEPPRAPRRRQRVERFGEVLVDDYAWLRDPEDPATRAWLEDNNSYTEAVLGHLDDLRTTIYDEIRSRVVETDTSSGVVEDGWVHYARTEEGQDYAIHCRRPASGDRHADVAPVPPDVVPDGEQVLLDENREADGHDYFVVGGLAVSPDHRRLAWLVDTTGRELYRLFVRDLATGHDTPVVDRATYGLAWSADATRLYWLEPDEAQRPHRAWRHVVGGPGGPDHDELLHQEDDERFWMGLGEHRSREFVEIAVGSSTTTEVRLVDARDPAAQPWVVLPRRPGVEYDVEHDRVRDRLLVTDNADGADDFRVRAAPLVGRGGVADESDWSDVLAHRPGVRVDGVDAFAGAVFVSERTAARVQTRILDPVDGDRDTGILDWPEEVHTSTVADNPDDDTDWYRFAFTSLTTPLTELELRLTGPQLRPAGQSDRHVVRVQPVGGGHDPGDYTSRRDWATAPDGTAVPISIVHRADLDLDTPAPCVLTGYGAYELSLDPSFSVSRLSLLDRGVVVAVAHVRGGGEMGRAWYLDGKFARKDNSFRDFVAVADHLVATGTTAHDRLAIEGGSAGGLLVGAVVNARPDLATAVLAEVPFVDVLSTMSDPTLPLTVGEYEEWGNPLEQRWFEVIRAYSPYDNVVDAAHPAMLVTAGLTDPRVGYWEPAKWVARLRDHTTSDAPILLRTEMGAGHGGPSGRYRAWAERAYELAFLLDRILPAGAADGRS